MQQDEPTGSQENIDERVLAVLESQGSLSVGHRSQNEFPLEVQSSPEKYKKPKPFSPNLAAQWYPCLITIWLLGYEAKAKNFAMNVGAASSAAKISACPLSPAI